MVMPKGAGSSAATKTINYTYDKLGRMLTVKDGSSSIGTYIYNNKGQRTKRTGGNGQITDYTYDTQGRLTSLAHNISGTSGDVTYSYTHDVLGEITKRSTSNSAYEWAPIAADIDSFTYLANGLNQYTSITGAGTISHDSNGNMTAWDGWSYTYDKIHGALAE